MIDQELEKRFTYHPPKGDQVGRYEKLRDLAKDFAKGLVHLAGPHGVSDELWRALDKLDEVVMLANAAIARNE